MTRNDEHAHQVALFAWAARVQRQYPELRWLYAVPNGGARSARTAGMLKAEGVRRGVPDIALDVARNGFHGLRIELKRPGKHAVTAEQREWIAGLQENGYRAEIAVGWDRAREIIVEYLTPQAIYATAAVYTVPAMAWGDDDWDDGHGGPFG